MKKTIVIGPRTIVAFPDFGMDSVPVKIDTGADSSSLWASDITETEGVLSFKLFGVGSPFYTGEQVTTKRYSIRSVKNSFGVTEFRYKVLLKVKLEGRTIRASFTLSDRSRNRYPILIGRRTLQGKFVVDVAMDDPRAGARSRNVLVLVNSGSPSIDTFYEQLNQEAANDLEATIVRYADLGFYVQNGRLDIKQVLDNTPISDYGLIYFMTALKNAALASVIAHYAKWQGITYVDKAVSNLAPDSKLHQAALMCMSGVAVPDSVYLTLSHLSRSYEDIHKYLGSPFILKDNNGRKGRNNYLIRNEREFMSAVNAAKTDDIQLLAQRFVDNDGYYRVVVMGKRVELVMFRSVDQTKSHLFNSKVNGPAQLTEPQALPGKVIAMCIQAADDMGWQIAGVDIVQDKIDGKWYCLEVNNSPQLVGGAFVDEKRAALARFFKEYIDK